MWRVRPDSTNGVRRHRQAERGQAPLTRCGRGLAIAWAVIPTVSLAQSSKERQATPSSPVVDSVRIVRENVFDRSESTNWLFTAANKVHVVTREYVVTRELLVKPGEPYDSATVAETERNLRKLGIFRDVEIDTVRTESALGLNVTTYDSWTTQLYTSFKAGGDQITWAIGVTEKNLLGTQNKASIRYTDDPDRSTTQFGVKLPRLWKQLGITASYDELSDGKRAMFNASAPFISNASKKSVGLELNYNDGDVLRFFEGEPDASDTVRHLLTQGRASVGWAARASSLGFVRLGTRLQVRREDFTEPASSPTTPDERSFFSELEFSVEASQTQFSVVHGYRNLGGREDVDLSRTVRLAVWLAPSAWGYERTGVGPAISLFAGKPFDKGLFRGFATAEVRASGLFTSEGLDSGTVVTAAVLALQPATRHSVVFNADVGWRKDPRPGDEFDLGLSFGPRGFPLHAFTGDRGFFTTAEYRWMATPDLWGLAAIGLAAFADYGGAWYHGSARRSGTDVGVGIRIGSTRSSSGKAATRVDFARRFANDVLSDEWVIAVGAGWPWERSK